MAPHLFSDLLTAVWLAWGAYWLIALVYEVATDRTKATVRRKSGSSLIFLALLILLFTPIGRSWALGLSFIQGSTAMKATGLLIAAGGIGFAIWARRYLGGNWSGVPAIKRGQTLVKSGPYAIVRHPIYAGLLCGVVGSAVVLGNYGSLIVVALAVLFVLVRITQEERLMREEFGVEYLDYAARVKALIPWIW
jgi:protein-S-isoprenylcysteine O-methyltransferase Ste14